MSRAQRIYGVLGGLSVTAALVLIAPAAVAADYVLDAVLPDGGDCNTIGQWVSGRCVVDDLTLEVGETIQVSAATELEFTGGLYLNDHASLTVQGTLINGGALVSYGTTNNAVGGVWINRPTGIIVNVFSINNFGTIFNEGEIDNQDFLTTLRNSGTIVNSGTIRNRGTVTNNGTIANRCAGSVVDDPVTGNPPIESILLDVQPTALAWCASPTAAAYDAIRGDLTSLRVAGDFALATAHCLASNHPATTLSDVENPLLADDPDPGNGFWFLARTIPPGGTYESWGAGQAAERDAALAASGAACP